MEGIYLVAANSSCCHTVILRVTGSSGSASRASTLPKTAIFCRRYLRVKSPRLLKYMSMISVKVIRANLECGGEVHCLPESFVFAAVHITDYFFTHQHSSLGKYSSHKLLKSFIAAFGPRTRRRCVYAAWMIDAVIRGRLVER